MDLDHLPAEIDASWWERHEHLFTWNERQAELALTPGRPREDRGSGAPAAVCDAPGLDDLVGQTSARERLAIAIGAARERGEPLRAHLFAGLPGVGKTSLARAVAAELAAPFSALPAPLVRTPDLLVRALSSLPTGAVLFLDEANALPARAAEILYEALDTSCLSLPVRQGLRTRTVRLRLRPFTLICATTDPEQLPQPLLSRLRVIRLTPYSLADLTTIIGAAAQARGLELPVAAAERLARASRDTPRRALAVLDVVHDDATAARSTTIDVAHVDRALAREGVDSAGLDEVERAYVRELDRSSGPVGLSTLSARLGVGGDTLRTVREPFLLRRGLIRITPLGRARNQQVKPALPDGTHEGSTPLQCEVSGANGRGGEPGAAPQRKR